MDKLILITSLFLIYQISGTLTCPGDCANNDMAGQVSLEGFLKWDGFSLAGFPPCSPQLTGDFEDVAT
jgi:hypothetical protein